KAHKMTGDNSYLFTIADYYYTIGRENDALYTLADIIGSNTASSKEIEDAYRKTITLYENASNYAKLSELVENCPIEKVKSDYSKYLVTSPEFSAPEGTYEEEILLKLSTTDGGTIYYTMDGTTPSETSEVFSTPLFLENGNYTISAVCYNSYGVAGPVVTRKYLINIAFEFKPVILTESGEYTAPTQITAEIPATERYYYTTDGSDPTQKSTRYTAPIQMPYGKSTFKFVSFAMDGTQSSVVTFEYDLHLDGLQPEDCNNALRVRLVERGHIDDPVGVKEGLDGYYTYEFNNVYDIEGRGYYYFYIEYLNDYAGNKTKSGTVYAVKVSDPNDINIVSGNAISGYILNGF
ncbi:MAG: chitobiase/beta-hexosaminidase C-terminal domain-containing protein, partial [Lachnospiraceae bacterium]|nr:chitobiase/beta-hexosaminidase C-terminal domain-containing protein [Lachnospiraceae bacterium]